MLYQRYQNRSLAVGRLPVFLDCSTLIMLLLVAASPVAAEPEPLPPPLPGGRAVFAGLEGAQDGLLLLDGNGLRIGGGLSAPDGTAVGDAVAAHLAGVFRDATRAARLLHLGSWTSVAG